MKPYVVSADIRLLLQRWATQSGFVLPRDEFFCQLRRSFSDYMQSIFSSFDLVSEDEIYAGLVELTAGSSLPILSLDGVYFDSQFNLEIARLADGEGKSCGLGRRAGAPSLFKQIRRLQMGGLREAVIVDDVVFSGALLERVVNLLSRLRIEVPLVCVGIGIAEGVDRIRQGGREVRCVRAYDQVIDEVCERDFYPGVPLSGRLFVAGDNVGIPYLLPFGKPVSWASIPSKHAKDFSRFCLVQTKNLFDEIGLCSNRPVLCQDLGRKVIGLPTDETRYGDFLCKIL
ncbi:MAG: hypothetical protein PHO91_04420 [Patescibacteria group bacterium]|nr:hypothetical protein [Patescibacteria group bacterium]